MAKSPSRTIGGSEELREHFAELEAKSSAEDPPSDANLAADEQIAELRRQVTDLQERLSAIREQTEGVYNPPSRRTDVHPWLRVVITAATTFVLARLLQHFRLGTDGTAIMPMLTDRLQSRTR
ncbi:hypothetical protein [Ensifer adhaerens]|uniref:hypothetical protein n=1 Tax=Ensifer adhaerens TaxID=106592 RepID=UPI00131A0064|nr:hypothetical protein [Ensifer adhaerens]